MKIIHINAINKFYSTGGLISDISQYVNSSKHDFSYVIHADGVKESHTFLVGNFIERKIHALLSRMFGLQGYFSYFATRKILNIITQIKPDIVHIHNLHANYINVNRLLNYLKKNNISTVITLHDCWLYTGHCTHYVLNDCYKWMNDCKSCPRMHKEIESWIFDTAARVLRERKEIYCGMHNLAVVGVSNWITREACKSILCDAKYFETIYNWIDLDVFDYKKVDETELNELKKSLNLKCEKIILGVAVGFSDDKGLDDFIKLSHILPNEYKIVLVGDIIYSRTKFKKNDINNNIIVLPVTTNKKRLSLYYAMADVFIQFSKAESLGITIAEAYASGTQCIGAPYTATKELISETLGALLSQAYSPEEVLEKVIHITERSGRDDIKRQCREYAKERFSRKNIKKYIELYKKMINDQQKCRLNKNN